MDTEDIPVLTEVYNTKTAQPNSAPAITEDDVAAIVSDITPKIEAEVTKKLTQSLSADLRKEFADELKKANQAIAKLEKKVAAVGSGKSGLAANELESKHQALLDDSKKDLGGIIERLSSESAEKMNMDIAAKVTGMQELAVSQVRAQLNTTIKSFEEGFKNEITTFKAQEKASLESEIKGKFESEHEAIQASLAQFKQDQMLQTKTASENLAKQTQQASDELLKAVTAYSEKLTEEANVKLGDHISALSTKQSEQLKGDLQQQLEAMSKEHHTAFVGQLNAELPEVKKLLDERVDEVFANALPEIMEEINTTVLDLIGSTISQVKLVMPAAVKKTSNSKK